MLLDVFYFSHAVESATTATTPKLTVETVPLWAKAFIDLFKCQGSNFEVERQYNMQCALKRPHCAVCALLVPRIVVSMARTAIYVQDRCSCFKFLLYTAKC